MQFTCAYMQQRPFADATYCFAYLLELAKSDLQRALPHLFVAAGAVVGLRVNQSDYFTCFKTLSFTVIGYFPLRRATQSASS